MKTLRLLISIFVLLNSLNIFAQEKDGGADDDDIMTPPYSNVIPPGPNAASLGKYGETPVSLFNGRTNVSIPLWEIQTKTINLPISLSYDAGGLKVSEVPSWVGAGWSLNAGGVITRVVRGEPDDNPLNDDHKGYMFISDIPQEGDFTGYNNDIDSNKVKLRKIASGKLHDYQYDNFYFNFAGYSGKFHLKNGHNYSNKSNNNDYVRLNFISIPFQEIKIEYIYDYTLFQIGGFKVTTPDGLQYLFTERELTSTITENIVELNSVNSWYLTEIIGLKNDTVSFEYEQDIMYRKLAKQVAYQECLDTAAYGYSKTSIAFIKTESPRLSKIITPDQILIFKEDSVSRSDIENVWDTGSNRSDCHALDEIKIYARDNDEISPKPGNYFKSFVFVSDYKIGYSRLTLNEVYEKTQDNQMPGYQFSYHKSNDFPNLGEALNNEDYWGFYKKNIPADAQNDLPKIEFISGTSCIYKNETGTNKLTDTASVKNGTLNKIIYPTKGYTLFEYEPNMVQRFSHTDWSLEIQGTSSSGTATASASVAGGTKDSDFEIENNGNYQVFYKFSEGGTGPGNGTGNDLKQSYSGTFEVRVNNNKIVGHNRISTEDLPIESSATVYLSKQFNTLTVESGNNNITVSASVSYDYSMPGHFHNAKISDNKVGGIRIKKISDYTAEGKLASERSYEYSGGKIFTIPVWFRRYDVRERIGTDINAPYKTFKCLQINSNNAGALGTVQGSYAGYSKVTELKKAAEDGTTIKTIKHFNNVEYSRPDNFPFLPVWQADPEVGKLNKEEIFSDNVKVKEIDYQYCNIQKGSATGFIAGAKIGGYKSQDVTTIDELFDFQNYSSYSYLDKLASKKTIEYFEGGKQLELEENYTYNEQGFPSKIEIVEINNNNKISLSEKKYAVDIADTNLVASDMYGAYILSPLVKQTTKVNNRVVDNQLISYKRKSNKYLPDVMRKQKINSNEMYEHIHFSKYDEYGNITEYYPADDYKTCLLWGYNYSKVIAKIENKNYDQVMAALGVSYETLQTKKAEALKNLMNNLRNHENMKDARITTYQYDTLLKMLSEQTDPNGNSAYYKYDDFGRLKYVKDQNENIIKTYDYHFKNVN